VSTITTNKQHNCHKQKKHHVKDSLLFIFITAPVFHAEMFELKAELDWNTTQTTAGRTTKWREGAAMNSINKKHGVNNNKSNNKQNNRHKEKKHQSMKDLLPCIEVVAPVFHAEMSELKAELVWNTTQTVAGRTISGGGGDDFNKKIWC
jgi:hypothetical protein